MAKVLIIDDDELVRQVTDLVLSNAGHDVTLAGDGLEGWELFQRARVDLVLLDVAMPGLSGLELLKRLRRGSRRDTKVVMLTAKTDTATVAEAKSLGVSGYLIKPFTPDTLLQRVKSALQPTPVKPVVYI